MSPTDDADHFDVPDPWSKGPPEYPKPRFIVPDAFVEAFREFFGDAAEIIPISKTRLDESQL
jgi:hypothetical protein